MRRYRGGGPPTDLYAVGAVLFEALSGRPPFTANSAVALVLAHRDEAPPSLASVTDGVHAAVAALVDQALAKQPAERPASAAAMATALRHRLDEPTAAGTTVLARPAPARGTRPTASTPRSTLVIAGAVGALLAFVAIALADRGGDGDDRADVRIDLSEETTSTVTTPSTATTVATTATTVPTTTTTTVLSIGTLTDLLSAGPEDYGTKGPDLLDKLQEMQRKRGRDQAEKAADLIEDISDWVEDGELDATVAAQARQLLEPVAGRGRGNSDED